MTPNNEEIMIETPLKEKSTRKKKQKFTENDILFNYEKQNQLNKITTILTQEKNILEDNEQVDYKTNEKIVEKGNNNLSEKEELLKNQINQTINKERMIETQQTINNEKLDDIINIPVQNNIKINQKEKSNYKILETTRPTASSKATTGSRTSVTFPFALYCFTIIRVAAGAVAVATDARTMAADSVSLSGIRKCSPINTTSTIMVVNSACTTPMMVACLPILLSCASRNSLPIANAIKPSARSEIRPKLSICSAVIPIPGIPIAPRTNGPIRTPETRYAVTAGSLTFLASLDKRRPDNSAMDRLKKTLAV